MGNEIEPQQKSGQTRRSFLAKLGLGAAALALVGGPLGMLGIRSNKQKVATQEFPGEDSIFPPASAPRKDPRRS